jgi:menaquinone-9 beta-reductase
MSNDYDVIVVGARVAGAMTALHLARSGYRVLVLDRAGPPADTLSTHALMRTAVLQLKRAGVLGGLARAGTPPVRRLTLAFDDQPFTFPLRSEFGVDELYGPRRTVLDPMLLAAAVEAGVEVETGRGVSELLTGDDRVTGVVVNGGTGSTSITARYVVGADGRNSTVARLVDAPMSRFEPATGGSVYTYFSGMGDNGFDFRFVNRKFVATVATNDDLTLVSVGVPSDELGDPRDTFETVLHAAAPDVAALAFGGTRVERFRFTPGIDSFVRRPAGPGWVLVGDAGTTVDPLSAHGISTALRDAELATAAIDAGLRNPTRETSAGVRYEMQRNRFALPVLEHTVGLADYLLGGDDASARMRALGQVTDAECRFLEQLPTALPRVA